MEESPKKAATLFLRVKLLFVIVKETVVRDMFTETLYIIIIDERFYLTVLDYISDKLSYVRIPGLYNDFDNAGVTALRLWNGGLP